ncbi:hypothetical protein MTR67_023585 [Solanum verrucosum]|uniref:Uncharacterized protein n=1 Tax=Solanum verrucosum TaxID=315347 RepID=A0AAF0QWS2_SOLVR|nr:hypothetical protein MTR67_023585 [Solanum verrucosum]
MAIEPPGKQLRPPEQSHSTRNSNMNKPQQGASSDSSDNSSKLQRIEAIHVAISEEELDWARNIMSLEQSGMIRVNSTGNHESTSKDLPTDQATAKDAAHHIGDEGELVRMTSVLNQGHNQDNEHTSNQMMQPLQQHQEKLFTMGSTDGNVQEKMQENQEPATTGIQEAQLANDEVHSGISKDKQHGKGEKTKWKAKDTINSNANTMQQSQDNGRVQPGNTNKEKAGKFVNFVPNDVDHSDTSRNKLHSGQNELGKGQVVVQAAGNEATGQAGKLSHISQDITPKILPPPVKISSNFDSYRPNQQRNNQTSPKQNQHKPIANSILSKNANHQIPDPSPPIFSNP